MSCVYSPEIRPGTLGFIDYIDTIKDVQHKVIPLLELLYYKASETEPDQDEVVAVLGLAVDMLSHVWTASDGIYDKLKTEVLK